MNIIEQIQPLLEKGLNLSEISTHLNKPYYKVYRIIKQAGLEYKGRTGNGKSSSTLAARRNKIKIRESDYEKLYDLYHYQNLSVYDVAKHFNTTGATVAAALRRLNIPVKLKNGKLTVNSPNHSKELLEKLYVQDSLSLEEIATLLNYSSGASVQYDLKKYKIERRNYKEAGKLLYEKHPEKRDLHRKQFYDGTTGPKFDKPTWIEYAFMKWADERNLFYVYQFQIEKGTHRFDFWIKNTNVLVEMDGVFWHSLPEHIERDQKFVEFAVDKGYCVVRITDEMLEEAENFNGVFDGKIILS